MIQEIWGMTYLNWLQYTLCNDLTEKNVEVKSSAYWKYLTFKDMFMLSYKLDHLPSNSKSAFSQQIYKKHISDTLYFIVFEIQPLFFLFENKFVYKILILLINLFSKSNCLGVLNRKFHSMDSKAFPKSKNIWMPYKLCSILYSYICEMVWAFFFLIRSPVT